MQSVYATIVNGQVLLADQVDWPEGTKVEVRPVDSQEKKTRDWPAGYFEQTSGAFADQEFERPPQGNLPEREEW